MIRRRDMLVGGAALAASASAWALTPRKRLVLARDVALDRVVPFKLPGWEGVSTDGLVVPRSDDDLASKLYNQIVQRVYRSHESGEYIMLLMAYGDTQNDLLQLHRPEVCYAAFGFTVAQSTPQTVSLGPGITIPARTLTATAAERVEQILYWTRIGQYLPTDGSEQRLVKLRTQMAGYIPDGILVRISVPTADVAAGRALNARFATDLLRAIPAGDRPALIGTDRALAFDRIVRA